MMIKKRGLELFTTLFLGYSLIAPVYSSANESKHLYHFASGKVSEKTYKFKLEVPKGEKTLVIEGDCACETDSVVPQILHNLSLGRDPFRYWFPCDITVTLKDK